MSTPGWAKPKGSHDGFSHWWRPDQRSACDPDSGSGYAGPTSQDTPPLYEVCPNCVIVVCGTIETAGLLGLEVKTPAPPP